MLYVKFYDEEYNPEDTPNKYNVVRDNYIGCLRSTYSDNRKCVENPFLFMLYYLHMYGNVK
jgi:hypothetical protein